MYVKDAQSEEANGELTAWIDVRVRPGAGQVVWIQAGGGNGQPSAAVAVPRDKYDVLPLRLDVTFREPQGQSSEWKWALESMTARIAPPRGLPGMTREVWEPLWQIQQVEALTDLARAGRAAVQLDILENALRQKFQSPVAAAIAAALLLRVGALDHLHDWPRNLANRFKWLPDGPILWAETLLRRSEKAAAVLAAHPEARRFFMLVVDRGPPLLTPVLAMASRQASLWRQMLEAGALKRGETEKMEAVATPSTAHAHTRFRVVSSELLCLVTPILDRRRCMDHAVAIHRLRIRRRALKNSSQDGVNVAEFVSTRRRL